MAVTIIPFNPGEPYLPFTNTLKNIGQYNANEAQGIENQYSPERLRLANQLKAVEAQYAPRKAEADIGYTEAQIPYTNALTKEAGARIPLIQSQVNAARMKEKYPGLGEPGIAGQIAYMQWLAREHPELAKAGGELNVTQNGTQVPTGGMPAGTQPLPQSPGQVQKLQNMFGQQNPPQVDPRMQQLQAMMGQQARPGMPGTFSPIPQQPQMQMPPQGGMQAPPGVIPSAGGPLQVDPNSLIGLMQQGIQGKLGAESARTNYLNSQTSGMPWTKLPMNEKVFNLAQARAFGLNSDEASKAFLSGKTLNQIASEHGYSASDPSKWPVARPAPTTAMQTQQQRANVAQAGIQAIEPSITKALAPYAQNWDGTSVKMLKDSLGGKNDEEVGKALGAAMMSVDLAMLRAKSGGINNIGIEMIKESMNKSLTNLHQPGLAVTPKQFLAAQKFIGEKFHDLNKAENKSLYDMGIEKNDTDEKGAHQMTDAELKSALTESE